MSKGWVCAFCTRQAAGYFCGCEDPEVFLCELCIGKHYAKTPGKMHHCLPVAAYGQHQAAGFYERFSLLSSVFEGRVASLRQSLCKIDLCSEAFNQKVNEIILNLQEYQTVTTHNLSTLKAELSERLERAKKLVEESLYADFDPSEDPIAQALRSEEIEGELSLFSYQLEETDSVKRAVESLLEYSSLIEAGSGVENMLPVIFDKSLLLFNSVGEIVKNIDLAFTFRSNTTVICLEKAIYFLEGETSRVFSMNTTDKELAHVTARRSTCIRFGIFAGKAKIYLFGGTNSNRRGETSCEKFKAGSQTWTALAKMKHGRCDFTPTAYQQSVLLPCASLPLESFSLTAETFRVWPITLPDVHIPMLSFMRDSELILLSLQQHTQYRLDLDRKETTFRMSAYSGSTFFPIGGGDGNGGSIRLLAVQGKVLWVWRLEFLPTHLWMWEFVIEESTVKRVPPEEAKAEIQQSSEPAQPRTCQVF